ncbi:MauE/DoxX family redox-associated membrane protein [Desertivirga brevis]|uniref:MauE/DoxX family redox-associated membrane protein n=1 Tax=Desertivirga brevis TaxID=2810310 RepID=UPI001A959098|nr:MauE/DoxX family redox-associated membrane protein [Pedobacter sp. SYSU D00873]
MKTETKVTLGTIQNQPSSENIITTCYSVLTLIYSYSALSKLLNFEETKRQMLNQPVPEWLSGILAWFIPFIELTTVVLLFFPSTRRLGFKLSTTLLLAFTLYVAMAMLNLLGETACTCGGLISYLRWDTHLLFNITLLILSITGLIIKERRNTQELNYQYRFFTR